MKRLFICFLTIVSGLPYSVSSFLTVLRAYLFWKAQNQFFLSKILYHQLINFGYKINKLYLTKNCTYLLHILTYSSSEKLNVCIYIMYKLEPIDSSLRH